MEDDDNNNYMFGDYLYEDGMGYIRLYFCVYIKKDIMLFLFVVG